MNEVRIRGAGAARVNAVYCVGRNYADHAREMNAPATPVVFLKPPSAVSAGGEAPWPRDARVVHHEVELVLLLGGGGRDLSRTDAAAAISGVGVGVDLTARDLQDEAKKSGQPWARSKGFPGAAPVSEFVLRDDGWRSYSSLTLSLTVDGALRQSAGVGEMILDPPAVVALLSRWFELAPGDLVFTGTPAGVGPILPGQVVVAECRPLSLSVSFVLQPPRASQP